MKRPTYPNYIQDTFDRDVAEHRMEIRHDQGLYRHLRFARPDTCIEHFDLVTWPGHLAVGGDRDTFTFARIPDMFEFFRRTPSSPINPGYWAEKVIDGRERAKTYSEELCRQLLIEHAEESESEYPGLTDAVRRDLLEDDYGVDLSYEDNARRAIDDFVHEEGGSKFRFDDLWEWNLRDWDYSYLWSCHAIVWGIRRYDARELTPEQWLTMPEFAAVKILDCDGWTAEEWSVPITRAEFVRRLSKCTQIHPVWAESTTG